jgi:DedD protein
MPLPSFFQRKDKTPAGRKKAAAAAAAPADDSGPVEAARTRARRRLIGALVLLVVGIVGFPLVFETQPRPIPVDIRIDAPASSAAASPVAAARPAAAAPKAQPLPVITESAADAGPEVPAAASAAARTPVPVVAAVPAPAAPTPAPTPPSVARAEDGQRAKALLDGGTASEPKSGRFVVQVGAFTDANALREARQKVEKLGLKTYTQVIETEAGKRTRVRVGPFATRDEADRTSAKLKSAGLPAAILTL